uniref:Uncharacterized protein n=1 Tax=Tanacetum cinerariifolium TaxID=118510 RepID=A0A6L2MQX0_TANCI|nr:hypothetical protein [Tanacetum cinerariifolium]
MNPSATSQIALDNALLSSTGAFLGKPINLITLDRQSLLKGNESEKESLGDSGEEYDDDEDDSEDESDDGNNDDNNNDDGDYNDDKDKNDDNDDDEDNSNRTESDINNADNEKKENKEEKDDAEELYRDVNVNLRKEDVEMTEADQGGADQQNVSQESGFDSSVSADFTDKLLNFKNTSPADNVIASLMDTIVRHKEPSSQTSSLFTVPVMVILEITSTFTTTIPPPPPFVNPLSKQSTPTPTQTASEITSFLAFQDFSSVFKFNDRVTNMEKDLSEMKQVDYLLMRHIHSLSEFKLTKILMDKIEEHKSYLRAEYKKELYDTLVKSYNTYKYLFETYGEVFTLKRNQDYKDKHQDPSVGSDRGTKSRKSSKDAESSRDPKSKESKSTSSSKETSRSQHKSSDKSAHAEEPSHIVDDSGGQQNQKFNTGNNDEQPDNEATCKVYWFKKPEQPTTPDHDWNKRQYVDFRPSETQISNLACAEKPPTLFDELMDPLIDFSAFFMNRLNITNLTQELLVVTNLKMMKLYDYGHLDEIEVRKEDQQLYKFNKSDFLRLGLQDIEDMLLLLVQQELINLMTNKRYDLNVALRMFTRCIVIQRRVEEIQFGVKSYQKKLNLTKPDTFRPDLKKRTAFTANLGPQGVIYTDQNDINRLLRTDELQKFSDGMFNHTNSAKLKTVLRFIFKKIAFCLQEDLAFCLQEDPAFCLGSTAQMHNNVMADASRDRLPMLVIGRYPQWRSRFLLYFDTRPNGDALRKCILSGPYKPTTVLIQAVEATDDSLAIPEYTIVETPMNMSPNKKAHFLAEKEAIHLILTGIGDEIYSTVDACQIAEEMWEAIERLQQGESLNIQDEKTNLFWEFGKFTSHDGETMESYYTKFYKLMYEMIRNNLFVTTMQVNV